MRLAGAFLLLAAAMPAQAADITRTCFAEFCVESREAFTAFNRQPARELYLLKISRTQTHLYLQTGPDPVFPHCGAVCRVEETGGEKRAFNSWTNRLVGRLVGPISSCKGKEPYFVHLFAYSPEIDPGSISIVRACE